MTSNGSSGGVTKFSDTQESVNMMADVKDFSADELEAKLVPLVKRVYANTTKAFKDVSKFVVALRAQHHDKDHKDVPDWRGNSLGYRAAMERMYDKAGIPKRKGGKMSDMTPAEREAKKFRDSLDYHIRELVQIVAPAEDKLRLGLSNVPQSQRQTKTEKEKKEKEEQEKKQQEQEKFEFRQVTIPATNDVVTVLEWVNRTLEEAADMTLKLEDQERIAALLQSAESLLTEINERLSIGMEEASAEEVAEEAKIA